MGRMPKSEVELATFQALAPLIGLQVVPGSIRQPDPPDIVCEVQGAGVMAFELVALDADETRMRLDNMGAIDDAWDAALSSFSPEHQVAIRAVTRHVYFNLMFSNEAGSRDRTAACRTLQEFLMAHPQHTGVVSNDALGNPRGFEGAIIHRERVTNGPKFSHFSGASWQPPQAEKLRAKLQPGRYDGVGLPLELFAYSVHDELELAVGSLEALQQLVVTQLPASSFRRAHLFNRGFLQHLWSYPS